MRGVSTGAVRVGLVGGGVIAQIAHLPNLARSRVGQLVSVADADARVRERLAFPGVAVRRSLTELLAHDDVDAVVIAAPSACHADLACEAFAAGRHVYLEKPLAITLDDGRRVVEAWRRAGTVGMVGYNFRCSAAVRAARARIDAGELGALVGIQTRFLWAAREITGWRSSLEQGGGVLPDLASHHIDLVAALTRERITHVACLTRNLRTPEDSATLTVTTAGGLSAQILVSFAAGAHVNELELAGRGAALAVNLLDARASRPRRPPGRLARVTRAWEALEGLHPARLLRSPGHEPSFAASLEAFLAAVRAGGAVVPTPDDGLHVLEVVEAARQSAAASGAPVPVAAASDAVPQP